ncbi:MAG: hypothetical protein HYV60_24565 [Planctomycetia bacterium]|nr:hypothetical protein [Planctomycetia bacterium]
MGIEALAGGRVNLPQLVQYVDQATDLRGRTLNLKADGLNSVIDLSAMSQLHDASSADYADCCSVTEGMSSLLTTNGGSVAIPLLSSVSGFEFRLDANTGYPTSGIREFVDGNLLVSGITTTLPALTDASRTRITADNRADLSLPLLRDADGVFLTANQSRITLPKVMQYANTSGSGLWRASGDTAVIDLPNLATLTQPTGTRVSMGIEALAGGRVNLPQLVQYVDQATDLRGRTLNLKADGLNSVIDLSAMSQLHDASSANYSDCCSVTEGMSSLVTTNGGEVAFGNQPTSITHFGLSLFEPSHFSGSINIGTGASLLGDGTIRGMLSSSGQIRPGNPVGKLVVSGDFTQSALGNLTIEIGGRDAATQQDRVEISGVATLSGSLSLTLVNGFVPSVGDSFQVVTYGSRVGQFETLVGLDIGGGKVLIPSYTATGLVLQTASALTATSLGTSSDLPGVSESAAQSLLAVASRQWVVDGTSSELVGSIPNTIIVQDLPGLTLAAYSNQTIYIDRDAAGWGWFVDLTPFEDEEFVSNPSQFSLRSVDESAAALRVDLLTALLHEIGHSFGLQHSAATDDIFALLHETLSPSLRRKTSPLLVDEVMELWDDP